MGYFTVDLKPDFVASQLQAGECNGKVLFDWTPIQVPKGTVCLRSVVALIRAKGDATPTNNDFPFDLYFSTTNTTSLGVYRGDLTHNPHNDYIGAVGILATNYGSTGNNNGTVVAVAGGRAGDGSEDFGVPIIMTPTETDSSGFSVIYVAGVSLGAMNFVTINTIETTEAASATIHCDGTGMDLREHFLPGDVLHTATTVGAADADTLIGTVLTVDSATNLTLTDTAAVTHVDGTLIMNINPIRIKLGFEQ